MNPSYQNDLKQFLNIGEELCNGEETAKLKKLLAQDKPLPLGYRQSPSDPDLFYKSISDLSEEILEKRMLLEQAKHIKTIKNCVVALTVLSGIFLVVFLYCMLPYVFTN